MVSKTISINNQLYELQIENDTINIQFSKSQTKLKTLQQLSLLNEPSPYFVPVVYEDFMDTINFQYQIDQSTKSWEQIKGLRRNDQLRILQNIAKFVPLLNTRFSFFLHPDNLVFDPNGLPIMIHRGIRDVLPPYNNSMEEFLYQYKCLTIAMFSKKYTFDELLNGLLDIAKLTPFDRAVSEASTIEDLVHILKENYQKEQQTVNYSMRLVSKKRFRLYKSFTIVLSIISLLLFVSVIYFSFVRIPFQNMLLKANDAFLINNFDDVIGTLKETKPEDLPITSKYELARSYISVEQMSEEKKNNIFNNISLRSDENYLDYWIHNGRGEFDQSLDIAKYIEDPQLIMYGYLKKIEQVKNNSSLSGSEREKKSKEYQEALDQYSEEYLNQTEENRKDTTN